MKLMKNCAKNPKVFLFSSLRRLRKKFIQKGEQADVEEIPRGPCEFNVRRKERRESLKIIAHHAVFM